MNHELIAQQIINKINDKRRKSFSTSEIEELTGLKFEPDSEDDILIKLYIRKLRGDKKEEFGTSWFKDYSKQFNTVWDN